MLPVDTTARCAGPGCVRPLDRAATGRPARYCGPNCRQAARREKARAAEEAAARAARLAEARATAARLSRPLEDAGFRTVADLAALVYAAATDPGRPRAELDQAIRDLDQAAARLAGIAREYRAATDLARHLDPDDPFRGAAKIKAEPAIGRGTAEVRPESGSVPSRQGLRSAG